MKKQLIAAAVVGAIAGAGYLGLVHTEGAAFDAAFNDAVADLDELARANISPKASVKGAIVEKSFFSRKAEITYAMGKTTLKLPVASKFGWGTTTTLHPLNNEEVTKLLAEEGHKPIEDTLLIKTPPFSDKMKVLWTIKPFDMEDGDTKLAFNGFRLEADASGADGVVEKFKWTVSDFLVGNGSEKIAFKRFSMDSTETRIKTKVEGLDIDLPFSGLVGGAATVESSAELKQAGKDKESDFRMDFDAKDITMIKQPVLDRFTFETKWKVDAEGLVRAARLIEEAESERAGDEALDLFIKSIRKIDETKAVFETKGEKTTFTATVPSLQPLQVKGEMLLNPKTFGHIPGADLVIDQAIRNDGFVKAEGEKEVYKAVFEADEATNSILLNGKPI